MVVVGILSIYNGWKSMELLYVDDEPALLELGKEFLELEPDVIVTIQPGPLEALAILSHKHFDIIISDYMMPDMNGLEFFKRLRRTGIATPFILFTGKGREDVVIDAMRLGVDFYIKKGGDVMSQFAELNNAIRQCTARKEAEESLEYNARRFRIMIENQSELIALVNTDATITYISGSVKRILGYEPEEIIGQNASTLFSDPSQSRPLTEIGQPISSQDGSFKMEAEVRHHDGSKRYLDISGRVLTKNGEPSEIIVNAYDVTGRKQDQRRINHLISVLKAIRLVNKRINSETEPMALLKSVCDIAVDRGYSTAWAVIFEERGNPARLVESGIGEPFDEVRANFVAGHCLACTEKVLSGMDIFVNENPLETCPSCPLNGFPFDHLHVAKPLTVGGHIFGQLSVTLPNELFSPEEQSVLDEIAEDLSFALYHLIQGQEKEEYQLSMVKMKMMFHERFSQMRRPTFVVEQEASKDGTEHRLIVKDSSDVFLDAMGFDGAIAGMEVGALAENVSDGAELVKVIEDVVRSKIPQSVAVRSAHTEADFIAFIFAPGTDYAGVMLIPTAKAESPLRIGRRLIE